MNLSQVDIKLKGYTKEQIGKIGNTIIFLVKGIQPLYKTKLLKLIYLLDELSIARNGIPFLGLDYKVWQAGPVCNDLYEEFNEYPYLLEGFIGLEHDHLGTRILAKKDFSDDEFSPLEIDLLNEIVKKYKTVSAEKLVELTHRKNSPWYIVASENNLLDAFDNRRINTTDLQLDLSILIKDDPRKLALYKEHLEIDNFSKFLQP